MNRIALLTPLTLALVLGGCATTLSGVGGSQRYACKAPPGVQCTSVSGVYANAVRGMAQKMSAIVRSHSGDPSINRAMSQSIRARTQAATARLRVRRRGDAAIEPAGAATVDRTLGRR